MTNFIHIGIGKTGTTTIQSMLVNNDEQLRKKGFLYPQAARLGEAHYGLFDLQTQEVTDFSFDELDKEIEEVKPRHLVLSSENLSFAPRVIVERLRATFDPAKSKILFYCRKQIKLVESVFLQWVKDDWDYRESISHFFEYHRDSFDFLRLIEPWAEAFGDENIIAHVYDRAVVGKNVATHFAKSLGIRGLRVPKEHLNPSLLPDFFPLIQRMDKASLDGNLRASMIADLLDLSTKFKSVAGSLVGDELKQMIVREYSKSNREFANRFLPAEERRYFLLD